MKLLHENTLYEFTVAQSEATLSSSTTSVEQFQIEFKYRKFKLQSPISPSSSSPDFEQDKSICFPRNQRYIQLIMSNLLEQEFEVPERINNTISAHFNFFLDNLSRRNRNNRGSINVLVRLDAKEISPPIAEAIRRRMESGRRNNDVERENRRMMVEIPPPLPPSVVVESLERERVIDENSDCSICLERFELGEEVIKLPCLHVFHSNCIVRWLERILICPFCRFKLPC
ncbi:hypothetical protein BVRB_5g121930 [Beta vulgaris subsp. vulgaris]|nr:hypothetical protein BVRB_5g121930 [Beta vulgaris subsp. vulgaris]